MEIIKDIKELESELKVKKKQLDKLQKKMKKCTSSFQYENMLDEYEILNEDILELKFLIEEKRRKKKEDALLNECED
jgi:predicted  nucleic acid-binding Zn-ribbon protein